MFALNLDTNCRILSASVVLPTGTYEGMPVVEELPDGNVADYLYKNDDYIYDPLPEPEPAPEPEPEQTDSQRIAALEKQVAEQAALLAAYEEAYAEGVQEA